MSEGFIRVTHAASINDSFWIKKDTETITWNDVSFYRNDFNDAISRLAFEGLGLHGMQMSDSVPEFTTDGSFRKCWKRENDEIYLYKRGRDGACNAGLEPYCEVLASEIINKADLSSVRYSILKFRGEIATKCKAFTDTDSMLLKKEAMFEYIASFFVCLQWKYFLPMNTYLIVDKIQQSDIKL